MAETGALSGLNEAVLFLGTAGVVIPLVTRLKVSPILGFLGAGILLGPFGVGKLADIWPALEAFSFSNPDQIHHFAELGVVFLLFMIGLELSLSRVRLLRKMIFGLGASQFLVSTLVLGLVAWLAGQPLVAAGIIGAALSMSSTAIVIPTLAERKHLGAPSGRASFAVLLFQDLAVTPLLVTVSLLASARENAGYGSALWTLAQAVVGLVVLFLVGRVILRPIFHSVALTRSPELFMAACLLVVLGAGMVAGMSGLSMAIGAFVGGLLLAETEFRREIEATIDPFRGLLLGLFFITIGAKLDLALFAERPVEILLITFFFVALKALVLYRLMPLFKKTTRTLHETALLLAPGGEFAFVLLAAAVTSGVLFPSVGDKLMVAVTLSMFLIPAFAALVGRMERRSIAERAPFDTLDSDGEASVIIVGCGRVGQMVGEMLARHKIPAFAIDMNQANVAQFRAEGIKAYYGDPTVPHFMERLHLENALALVLTLNNPAAVEVILAEARRINPSLSVVARARDRAHAQRLYEQGATDAVPETFEASLQLAEAVLLDVGVPMGLVIASVHDKREKTRARLKAGSGEARAPRAVRRLKPEA